MNKIRVYNDYEMSILLNNHNVDGIKNNSQIIYNNSFKLWAVMQRLNTCKTAKQIFAEAGFDMNIIDERTPQKRICSWVKKYKMFGKDYFDTNNKYTYKSKIINKKVIDNDENISFFIDEDNNIFIKL